MADTQIRGLGESPAPLVYTVPGAQEIILKSLFASFDGSSAGSDFFPCVRVRAPGGGIVGEYITQAAVTAGSSADVSFAPFLRGGSGASAAPAVSSPFVYAADTSQVIPSGAVTALIFDSYSTAQGSQPMIDLSGFPATFSNPTVLAAAPFFATLTVYWPAANYDRYTEIAPQGPWVDSGIFNGVVRDSVSPNGDVQTLTMAIDGATSQTHALNMQVFQASGVDRTISARLLLRGLTTYIPPTFS